MPCEHFKEALIEAAASGAEPQAELRMHLAACNVCRTVLAEEQSLFISIDSGLRQSVNSEVPASLLPRVRARISDEVVPHRSWFTNWLTVASAAAIIAAFLVVRAVWRPNLNPNPSTNAAQTDSPTPVLPPREGPVRTSEPPARANSYSNSQTFAERNSPIPRLQPARNSIPEVLVPRDQEVLLIAYAEQWRARKRAPLVAEYSDGTTLALLQIAPIQIAQLDVKLLAEEIPQ
jgi:hypothetical protein